VSRSSRAQSSGRRRRSGDSLAARAYEAIKGDIVSARLAPGAPIFEEELARRLRMSRTPVREAVKRLENENLVRRIPRRGVLVDRPSIGDVVEICEIRALLESHAARVAAARVGDGPLEKLEEEFEALDVPDPDDDTVRRASGVGRELHQLILEAAGNRQLTAIMSRLMDMLNPLPLALTPIRYRDTLEEHRAILAALRARDGEAAGMAMERHIDAVRRNLHVLR
jgi:DNA-binding GntR family transcriptional regulator